MDARRWLLPIAMAAMLAGCTGGPPGPAGAGQVGQGGSANEGGPGAQTAGAGGGTTTSAAPSGTIRGSFNFHGHAHRESDTVHLVLDEDISATFDVRLKRDTSAVQEAYVDDGSTYTIAILNTTERELGNCMATSQTKANGTFAFAQSVTSYPNSINAKVDRGSRTVLFEINYSWIYNETGNACDGRPPYTGENSAAAFCPGFGLTAKLIEGNGTDQIDTTCGDGSGQGFTGSLTLTR